MGTRSQTQQLYSHAAEPKPVQTRRPKQRHDDDRDQGDDGLLPSNIMFDRRVVRGNTYAARLPPAEPAVIPAANSSSKGRSAALAQMAARPPRTPDAVPGRCHTDVQTDMFLEELSDAPPGAPAETQTDAFLVRPLTPAFVPAKGGVDAITQIDPGDLFDFDLEVEPLLEVLVGKVLEQGLLEVAQEEELAAMRAAQAHFESVRAAELIAVQRLEAAERRKMEERDRRLRQERERRERERVVRAKVAASAFARGYLDGIVGAVFHKLQETGFFADPVEEEVAGPFMAWLQDAAEAQLARLDAARGVAQQLVADAVELLRARADARLTALVEAEAAAAAAAAREEEDARRRAEAADAAGRARAALILSGLDPPVVDPAEVEAARAELAAAAAADADAAWEAERARVGEALRAKLEGEAEEQRQLAAAAGEEGGAEGEEEGEDGGPAGGTIPEGDEEAAASIEAAVAAAMDAVARPPPKEVSDGDVLGALVEKGALTREAVARALAIAEAAAREGGAAASEAGDEAGDAEGDDEVDDGTAA